MKKNETIKPILEKEFDYTDEMQFFLIGIMVLIFIFSMVFQKCKIKGSVARTEIEKEEAVEMEQVEKNALIASAQ